MEIYSNLEDLFCDILSIKGVYVTEEKGEELIIRGGKHSTWRDFSDDYPEESIMDMDILCDKYERKKNIKKVKYNGAEYSIVS